MPCFQMNGWQTRRSRFNQENLSNSMFNEVISMDFFNGKAIFHISLDNNMKRYKFTIKRGAYIGESYQSARGVCRNCMTI